METEVDVVIIGGGISGLTAAYTIHKKDQSLRILVLEAKDRVGGRTYSVSLKTADGSDTWDLGGQWVGRCQPHITEMLTELGIDTHPQYITGTKFMQIAGNSVSSYEDSIPSLSGFALLDLHYFITKVERMAREVSQAEPYQCTLAKEWDCMTLETFVQNTMWTGGAKECVRACNRVMLGTELSQVSLLYYLTYVAAAGGSVKNLIECTPLTAQESIVKGGAQQVAENLKKRIGESNVRVGCPVHIIEQTDDYIKVKCKNGETVKAKRAIIATPPSETYKISFNPVLPSEKQEIVKRMPVGDLIKVIITYKQSFWRKAGQSGEVVTNGGLSSTKGCDSGPLCVVYDDESPSGSPALVGFIGGMSAVQWRKQEYSERQTAVLKSMAEFFGEEIWSYIDYREQDWGLEPYIGGAPVCCVSPGAMRSFSAGLRHPFMRLHFAGTESATVWCGFMNGAVQAGTRAAHEVLYHLRPQSLSRRELTDTIHGPQTLPRSPLKGGISSRSVGRLAVGFGAVVLVAVVVKKVTDALQSHP